ncbi:hypothetical protein AA0229_1950 [Gluconobacter cerinus NRIC 0229]|nr:hypothetical protein AA0229_1950 [Gluconobacter cerinus NRIC 0229]
MSAEGVDDLEHRLNTVPSLFVARFIAWSLRNIGGKADRAKFALIAFSYIDFSVRVQRPGIRLIGPWNVDMGIESQKRVVQFSHDPS